MSTIDPSQVNILEADVEQYLWENPQSVWAGYTGEKVEKWIARQYRVNSGIIDLLGVCGRNIVVVEIKNVEVDSSALTQIFRYADDIIQISNELESRYAYWNLSNDPESLPDNPFGAILKTIVFPGSISNQTMHEANAMGIVLQSFNVELNLKISSPWEWKDEYKEELRDNMLKNVNGDVIGEYLSEIEVEQTILEAERIIGENNK